MKFVASLLAATCLTLSACATLPPSSTEMAKLPVIPFGQPQPAGDNHIIRYPAGQPLPVTTIIDGSLFEKGQQSALNVVLKHDIYAYRHFASLDGQHWLPARKLIDTHLELQIPQKNGDNAGMLHLQMDEK
jgi:hypothetical protein